MTDLPGPMKLEIPGGMLEITVTEADLDAAGTGEPRLGSRVVELAIHRALDERNIPRAGRLVIVTPENITIQLPPGYGLAGAAS